MTAPTIPTTASELEETLADQAKVMAMIQNGQFQDLVKNYARTVLDKDQDISRQVQEEVQRVTAQFLRDSKAVEGTDPKRLNLAPNQVWSSARSALYNKRAPGVALDNKFESIADFMKTIYHNAQQTPERYDKLGLIRAAMGEKVPSDGGYLVPEVLRAEILRMSLELGIVRPRARVIPMETLRIGFPAIDSTSNATSVYGGIVCYWTEENAQLTETNPAFGRVVLDAKKLTAYTTVPNELLNDSPSSLEVIINQLFPEALAFEEDDKFLMSGTGVGEPLGALNTANGGLIAVAKESNQTTGTIVWENIAKAFSRMLPASLGRAVWVAHIDTFSELATMALSVGTGGSAVWLTNGAAGPPMTILGRPVIFTEKANTVGTQGDISFVDFGHYLIGDRQTMVANSSEHVKFNFDQTAFRFIERVDGRPWVQSPITPRRGNNTLSPYVQLATRA